MNIPSFSGNENIIYTVIGGYIVLYCVISCYIMLYRVISCYIVLYRVTAYDFVSGHTGSNPEWGTIYYETLIAEQDLSESSSLRGSKLVPEQLNIKAVTGAYTC